MDSGVLAGYGRRCQTRTDHLRMVADYLGWHQAPPDSIRYKELRQFLLDLAMEHDSPTLLFNLAADYDSRMTTITGTAKSLLINGAGRAYGA